MFKKTVAQREKVKLMIGVCGPSGSGKTYSSLQLAYGIVGDWKKIAFADTENKSALYYAGDKTGEWEHIDFPSTIKGGYHPNNWINLIQFVEQDPNIEVLILDSISHEWDGNGGCLQLVELFSKTQKGNTFTPWKTVTPLHAAFIDKMRESRLHIIATMRAKSDYSMEKNEYGKTSPKKVGLKPIQRDGIEYEFGIWFDLDADSHYAIASKDRTGTFSERKSFLISPELGKELSDWAGEGKEPEIPLFTGNENQIKWLKGIITSKDTYDQVLESIMNKPLKEADRIVRLAASGEPLPYIAKLADPKEGALASSTSTIGVVDFGKE